MWRLSYVFVSSCFPGAINTRYSHIPSTEPDMLSVSKQLQVHVNRWKDSTEILAIFYSLKYLHRFRYTDVTFLSAERFERNEKWMCFVKLQCVTTRDVWWCAVWTRWFSFALPPSLFAMLTESSLLWSTLKKPAF